MAANPAVPVRGPKYSVKKGKAPVLTLVGNHSFRATGITELLRNGKLEDE